MTFNPQPENRSEAKLPKLESPRAQLCRWVAAVSEAAFGTHPPLPAPTPFCSHSGLCLIHPNMCHPPAPRATGRARPTRVR